MQNRFNSLHTPLWYIKVRVVREGVESKIMQVDDALEKVMQVDETPTIAEPKDTDTTLADYIGYVEHTREYKIPNMLIRDINNAYEEEFNDDGDTEDGEVDTLGLTQKHINFVEPIGDVDDGNFECEMANFNLHGNDIDYMMLESSKLGTGYDVSFLQWNDPSGENNDDTKSVYLKFFVLYPQ